VLRSEAVGVGADSQWMGWTSIDIKLAVMRVSTFKPYRTV